MQVGDDVQIAQLNITIKPNGPGSVGVSRPIEFGAKGDAVRLFEAHYSVREAHVETGTTIRAYFALTTDPAFLVTPPLYAAFFTDDSFYGRGIYVVRTTSTVDIVKFESLIIPLWGIIRPRRQIFCAIASQAEHSPQYVNAEFFYESVDLSLPDMASLNRKYGKYRRT
ncbi:hypothetical protein ES703_97837 [subsurface metagenome]